MASKLLASVISDRVGHVLSLGCVCRLFTEVRDGTAVWSPLPLYECIKKRELGSFQQEVLRCVTLKATADSDFSGELVLSVRVDFLKYC